jgi:uncharacterized protein (TIGR02099 family)
VNEAAATRRPWARLWRIVAGVIAALLIVAALGITALRLALANAPEYATRLQAWIERETRMRIEYSRLDARLRWYGPEVVLHDVRVLDRDGSQALFATREGSVGLDVWNFFRTGEFVAGRVRFDAPRVTLVRLADGRIRLLGQRERPADQPPFDLDRLPAGRVVIDDATVFYRDLKAGLPALQLDDLDLTLSRDRDFVLVEGRAQLPDSLGKRVEFSGRVKGSLDEADRLEARIELQADELRLAGFRDRLPQHLARPAGGRGPVRAVVAVAHGGLQQVRIVFDLRNVLLKMPARNVPAVEAVQVSPIRLEQVAGKMPYPTVVKTVLERPAPALPTEVRYAELQGDLRLRSDAGGWVFRAEALRAQPTAADSPPATRVAGKFRGKMVSTFALELELDAVDLATLWPLALAFAPPQFDRWAGLAPTGRINTLRLQAGRQRAGLSPSFNVNAEVAELGVQPHARLPGLTGISATLQGDDQAGTVQIRGSAPTFDWPRMFRAPLVLERANADLTWRRDGDAWVVDTRDAELVHTQAQARLDLDFRYLRSHESPVLNMSARVDDIDVTVVSKMLPVGRLRERTIAWLDGAFKQGSATNGKLTYRGPVRKFPFRQGEGDFSATVDAQDVTLDYYPGFAPLTAAVGTVTFHNAGIGAKLASGRLGGLQLTATDFELADYKFPVLDIAGAGTGDLGLALGFLQRSPLGPRLGTQFMGLSGSGPTRYTVNLLLPVMSQEALAGIDGEAPRQDYRVRADLDSVTVMSPALRTPAQKVTGTFDLHNDEVRLRNVRGVLLDGPFQLTAAPGRTSREVLTAVDFTARGNVGGARLPAFIGLPKTIRMNGTAGWKLQGRLEKRREGAGWPLQIDVDSDLTGLQISAPRPFAKAASDPRSTRVRLEVPGNRLNDIAIESGSARAHLRFAEREGKWRLDRGAARFDGQPVTLPAQPGLYVSGDWPEFDLTEWLGLRTGEGGGGRLSDWLGPVDVHLDRATVLGYQFDDVTARLRSEGAAWRISASGPQAEGVVLVPDDLSGGRPIVLEMQRLHLLPRSVAAADGEDAAASRESSTATDPRTLPAVTLRADDFTWRGRRFGQLQAKLARESRGLALQTLVTTAPEFTITGQGTWFMEASGPRTRLELELSSTDFAATERALGYRDAVDASKARFTAQLGWPGGPGTDILALLDGTLQLSLEDGQLSDVEPGAGRMLGLLSVAELPRRLALDFRDVTDKGLAFDTVRGDFQLRNGSAYTQNLLLKGPAVDIGVVGRTGIVAEDYDQTIVVSGNPGGPLVVAGALAGGPVGAAGALLISQLFKGQLQGLTRAYYRVTGHWSAPVVERVSGPTSEAATGDAAKAAPAATGPGDLP